MKTIHRQKHEQEVSRDFVKQLKAVDIEMQIDGCKYDELEKLITSYVYEYQPCLEAGCGSGKWMHYLKKRELDA
jgi:hypothetical protein